MALTTEHAARQMQGPFGSCGRKTIHSGDRPIVFLTCALQDGSSGVASVRFPVQHWTPEEAKGWLKDHGFRANTFVVAKGYGMPKSRKTMGYAGKRMVRRNHADLSEMVQGYMEAALWTSTDESTPAGGEPLDKNYSPGDIDEQSQVKMARDCEKFYDANEPDCHEYMDAVPIGRDYTAMEKLGHDFWLTRNGHGTGFWDRDVGPVGDRLSKAAKKFGESNLYVGDDGAIYVS